MAQKHGISIFSQTGVLVKFTVRSRDKVPTGIPERIRGDEGNIDSFHAAEATAQGKENLAAVSRVRDGRIDTGEPVYQGARNVLVDTLRMELLDHGFGLASLHYFVKKDKWDKESFVIVADYRTGGQLSKIPKEIIQALRELADPVTWTVHIWDNSKLSYEDGRQKPLTINMVARSEDAPTVNEVSIDGKTGWLSIQPMNTAAKAA
jgi:hypothetical protein